MKQLYAFFVIMIPLLTFSQVLPITATEAIDLSAYDGTASSLGQGEYQIFLGDDAILDRPVIAIDGFDPGDSRDIASIYASLEFTGSSGTQNLADVLRAEGFDIVILNFPTYTNTDGETIDGGADFMERNAMVLTALIDLINIQKASNNPEPNVIVGPSMGGIIGRFALSHMEANGNDPDTRLYISFDSPHLGANIPIGFQHQLNYLAFNEFSPIPEIQPLISELLNSSAAKQLLIDHYETHLLAGSLTDFDPNITLPQPHPYRVEFQNRINALTPDGFPQNIRNVAIVNGSGVLASYFAIGNSGPTVDNGYPVITSNFDVTIPNPFPIGSPTLTIPITIDVNFTPSAGTAEQVSSFVATTPFGAITSTASSGTVNFDGVDAAPGGLFDLSGITNAFPDTGPAADLLAGFGVDKFNFIPTVSALALDITEEPTGDNINWFHPINLSGRGTTNNTPFDNTFIPDENEPHVQLTEPNVMFALSEILDAPLHMDELTGLNVTLNNSLVDNTLHLSTVSVENAEICIFDLLGKPVYKRTIRLELQTIIPVELSSGFYILTITTDSNTRLTEKFYVR
jgi:hypothetical protein